MDKETRGLLLALSGIFGLLNLIPVVNIFTNILWWLIWGFIMLQKGPKHLKDLKILSVMGIFLVLGFIPFIPWNFISTLIINHMIKSREEKEAADAQAAQEQQEAEEKEEEMAGVE